MKDELKHYGTPGMRWGVQNGPPYPLSRQPRFGGNGHNKDGSKTKGSGRSGTSNEPKQKKVPKIDPVVAANAQRLAGQEKANKEKGKRGAAKSPEELEKEASNARIRDVISGKADPTTLSTQEINRAFEILRFNDKLNEVNTRANVGAGKAAAKQGYFRLETLGKTIGNITALLTAYAAFKNARNASKENKYTKNAAKAYMSRFLEHPENYDEKDFSEWSKMLNSMWTVESFSNGTFKPKNDGGGGKNKPKTS